MNMAADGINRERIAATYARSTPHLRRTPAQAVAEFQATLRAVRQAVEDGASLKDIASGKVVPLVPKLIFNTRTRIVGPAAGSEAATGPPTAGTGPPIGPDDPDSWHF